MHTVSDWTENHEHENSQNKQIYTNYQQPSLALRFCSELGQVSPYRARLSVCSACLSMVSQCRHNLLLWTQSILLVVAAGNMDAKINDPAAENPWLSEVLSFKPGVAQNKASGASSAARNTAFLPPVFIYVVLPCCGLFLKVWYKNVLGPEVILCGWRNANTQELEGVSFLCESAHENVAWLMSLYNIDVIGNSKYRHIYK